MKSYPLATVLLLSGGVMISCGPSQRTDAPGLAVPSRSAPGIAAFIATIRAVDHHSHPNSVAPDDADADALPLDGIVPFDLPAPLHSDHPDWLAAYKALYSYPYDDLSDAHMSAWRPTLLQAITAKGEQFPAWVMDQVGTEVLFANRIALGPGLPSPRVRWVSFVDALMFPLDTAGEAAETPDRAKLFPLEDRLLRRYMSALRISKRPATLDAYLRTVVTPTLEAQRKVLFGSDASAFGPDMGWELAAWVGTKNARSALATALTSMIKDGEVSRSRAEEIATMVMRTNASTLYKLGLK